MNKEYLYINNKDVSEAVNNIYELYKGSTVNIITNWRGGLPFAIHLNNVLNKSTLSLLKYQTTEGNKDLHPEMLYGDDWKRDNVTLFIDDIYDTGESSRECIKYIQRHFGILEVDEYYILSKDNTKSAHLYNDSNLWAIFPWEV